MNMQYPVMSFLVQYFVVLITVMAITFGFGLLVTGRALVKLMSQTNE